MLSRGTRLPGGHCIIMQEAISDRANWTRSLPLAVNKGIVVLETPSRGGYGGCQLQINMPARERDAKWKRAADCLTEQNNGTGESPIFTMRGVS